MSNPVCYTPALSKHLILLRDENELFEYLTNHPHELDAAIVFPHAQAAAAACRPGVTNSACGDTASLLLPPGIAGDGSSGVLTYALRFNSSDVPPTALTRDIFDVSPGAMPLPGNLLWTWRRYWFFVNLQLALDRALLGGHIGHGTAPAPLRVRVKPFPWCAAAGSDKRHKEAQTGTIHQPHPAPLCALRAGGKIQFFEIQFSLVTPLSPSNLVLDPADIPHPPAPDILLAACCGLCIAETHPAPLLPYPLPLLACCCRPSREEDMGAASAGALLTLLLVFAFLSPTRAVIGDIVRERELRLREGMRVLGLTVCDCVGIMPHARMFL